MAKYVDESGVRVLWRKIQTRTEILTQETVYITLNSNNDQPIYTTITVSINDEEIITYEYNNSPISFKVPGGSDYNIKLGAVEDHNWPIGYDVDEGITYTSIVNSSRNLTFTYNTCYITFSIKGEDGYLVGGEAIITYTHNEKTKTQTIHDGDGVYIPGNIDVMIEPQYVQGYITPSPHTITTESVVISHTISYIRLSNNVKILSIDGVPISLNSWNEGSNATGVLLQVRDDKWIVIAPDEWYSYGTGYDFWGTPWGVNTRSAWSANYDAIQGIKDGNPDDVDAVGVENYDFDGFNNTIKIIEQSRGFSKQNGNPEYYFSGAPAAEYCQSYSNGCKGVGEWYLPAMSEVAAILLNFDEINIALGKIYGDPIRDHTDNTNTCSWNKMWTSNQYNNTAYWLDMFQHDKDDPIKYCLTRTSKNADGCVRPVAAWPN